MPVVFTGTTFGGVSAATTYYVANIASSTTFTIASTVGGANVNLSAATGTMYINPVQYLYLATQNYNSTATQVAVSSTTATINVIGVSDTTSLNVNDPIIFSGTTFGGITAGTVYYIKSIPVGGQITISQSRTNGIAGSTVALTSATGNCYATAYHGSAIWKRIALSPW